jgi:predicted metal-dependent peptidase
LWNIAGDYIINRVLHDSGISLPKGALLSDKYNGTMTTEYVYNDLLENSEDMQEVISAFNSSGMPDIDPTDLSPEDVNKIKQILGAAAQVGKAAGNMPAGLEELIEGMLNPKVPWYVLMRRYVQEIIGLRDDYTYVRPNKRYEDLIIPSAYTGEMVTCIVVAIDSSASVSSDDLKQFASEVGALSSAVADLIVLSCDTEVHEIARKDSCEDKIASLKVVGRGGTYFEPVFQWVRESGVIPDVLVYMTDGYAEFPEKAPGYPVVWLINNNQVDPPWGNTIRI